MWLDHTALIDIYPNLPFIFRSFIDRWKKHKHWGITERLAGGYRVKVIGYEFRRVVLCTYTHYTAEKLQNNFMDIRVDCLLHPLLIAFLSSAIQVRRAQLCFVVLSWQ